MSGTSQDGASNASECVDPTLGITHGYRIKMGLSKKPKAAFISFSGCSSTLGTHCVQCESIVIERCPCVHKVVSELPLFRKPAVPSQRPSGPSTDLNFTDVTRAEPLFR